MNFDLSREFIPIICITISGLPNLMFARMDFEGFINMSKIGEFWSKCRVDEFVLNQESDILRLLLLEQFGGAYLDVDVISIKNIPANTPNFIFKSG